MWLIPPMVEFFRNEYITINKQDETLAMAAFQKYCSEIPKWNQDIIDANVATIMDNCHCDYIEELMTAVFIAHTKMLTAIRVNSRNKKLQITLPKLDHFLHRVFIECARSFWKSPYIFSDEFPPIERQKNILQAEAMCTEALSGAVRSLLPVKSILKDYLEDDGESNDVEEPEEKKKVVEKRVEAEEPEQEQDHAQEEAEAKRVEEAKAEAQAEAEAEAEAEARRLEEEVQAKADAEARRLEEEAQAKADAEARRLEEEAQAQAKADAEAEAKRAEAEAKRAEAEANRAEDIRNLTLRNEEDAQRMRQIEDTTTKIISNVPISILKTPSNHSVEYTPTPNSIQIETEPVVHFTPYDTVYDHTTKDISEIRYSPKISVEDKPMYEDNSPKLVIHANNSSDRIESIDLDGSPKPSMDAIDIPLSSTIDFVELS